MPVFSSTSTHDSQVFSGVRFTVRRLNAVKRALRNEDLASVEAVTQQHLAVLRVYQEAVEAWKKGGSVGPEPVMDAATDAAQKELVALMYARRMPVYLRHQFISIEGDLEIDGKRGKAITADVLLSAGPELDGLLGEIYGACVAASDLTAEQEKNSPSPGTSPEAADGQASSTTAEPAAASATS